MIEFKFTGGKGLEKALLKLPRETERKVGIAALRAGSRVIIIDAKKRVPVDSGILKKGFFTKAAPKRKGTITLTVATKGGRQQPWYAHLVEFGTKHIPPRPFFRPAIDEQRPAILKAIADKLRAGIIKAAGR